MKDADKNKKSGNNAESKGNKSIIEKIKNNHALMMIICCGAPLILILAAVYFFGLSKSYLFWFMLLLCPLMHYFMMRDMHKGEKKHGKKEKGGCH